MKILAFAASNSRRSINKQLVSHASSMLAKQIGPEAKIETIDLNDYEMPIYSVDRENETGIPAMAHRFFNKIREADVVLISFAEHNGSYSAAYKNLYDWASRIDMRVYEGKPMLLLATSPGPGGAKNVLKSAAESLPHFGADVRGTFSLDRFHDNFDQDENRLVDPKLTYELAHKLNKLISREQVVA